jgi:PAS domain S-box-containing protein
MIGHSIILVTIGLAIMSGILWRIRTVKETTFSAIMADTVVALYIVTSGILSLYHSFGRLQFLDETIPAVFLILMPAAISASRAGAPARERPSTALWLIVGLALASYSAYLSSRWSYPGFDPDSASLLAALFLFISMMFFKRYHRFLLGLSAATWAVHLAHVNSMGLSGIGIVMGVFSFSSIISLTNVSSISPFDFDLRAFIKSMANPCLILDLSGKTIYCSEQFVELSGRRKEDIIGGEAIDMFDIPLDWRFRLGPSERYRKIHCHLISSIGEKIPVQLVLSEVRDSHGELKKLFCEIFEEREKELLESRLKNESSRFASFYETSQALSSSLELKDVLRSIAHAAENLTRSDSCTICTLDHGRKVLKPVYSSEEDYNAEVMNFEIAIGDGLTGAVVADGKPRIQNYDDASKVAVHIPGTSEEEESLLSMPLVAKDTVIGALTLYKLGGRRFEQDDLKMLTVFASQASAIIETSRLYMKLKASERLYKYSVDLAGDAMLFVDFESGKITDANEMALKLFKYLRAELFTMRIWELNPEPQMQIAKRLWEEVRQTGWGKLGDVDYVTKDGSKIPTSVNVSVIYTGEINSIQWMIRDVSEYKRDIEKMSFFHQIFEHLDEPILVTTGKGKMIYSNKAFCDIFGLELEEINRGDVASISLQGSRLDLLTACWSKLRGRNYLIDEIIVDSNEGNQIKKVVSILPYRSDRGDRKCFIWLFHPPIETAMSEDARGLFANSAS